MRRIDDGMTPVIANLLLVAISVVLMSILYMGCMGIVTNLSHGGNADGIGATLEKNTHGWMLNIISSTRDFPIDSTSITIQKENGEAKLSATTLDLCNGSVELTNGQTGNITYYDNNNDNHLNAGDVIFIGTDTGAVRGDIIQLISSTSLLCSHTLS